MEAHTARTLAHQVRQSNLGPYEQNALLTVITYAMRYSALIDVMATTEATNGNRALLDELWQACTYDVRADMAGPAQEGIPTYRASVVDNETRVTLPPRADAEGDGA